MQLAGKVIEYHHLIGNHQQDIRVAQWIGIDRSCQSRLHIAHTVITEIAHQTAVEARQPGNVRHPVTGLELLDEGQRILALMLLGEDAIDLDPGSTTLHLEHGTGRQADDGVTPPFLAALH